MELRRRRTANWIPGGRLSPSQKEMVLNKFYEYHGFPNILLDTWISLNKFRFIKDGSRLFIKNVYGRKRAEWPRLVDCSEENFPDPLERQIVRAAITERGEKQELALYTLRDYRLERS